MWQYVAKVAVTALVVVGVAELAKRGSFWAAVLASLPLTSLLAFVWIYLETGDSERIAVLSQNVLWLVIPSLVLFMLLPVLLRSGFGFWLSLLSACAATATAYAVMIRMLPVLGIEP